MHKYSVKQLSKLAGVSVRTLHHYDKIGLLKPAARSDKGYRFYKKTELLKLQQILFYKNLSFPLKKIKAILEDPDFDLITALEFHQEELKRQAIRTQQLLVTIKKTISQLKSKNLNMTDKELYQGFSAEEAQTMREEVKSRWGEKELLAAEERIRQMGKSGWNDTKRKGEEINQLLADLMDLHPSDAQVQQAIALHFRHMNCFYKVSEARYRGLAQMYVEDTRFKANYDKYRNGLAVFIRDSIFIFCENGMGK
ncbi:MAG TPA: MerR family transcriptional regulator [Phaeodactylibacter sp.]|nr:MerR family transcriptional regulator [Phaeodactylibacter sp.]